MNHPHVGYRAPARGGAFPAIAASWRRVFTALVVLGGLGFLMAVGLWTAAIASNPNFPDDALLGAVVVLQQEFVVEGRVHPEQGFAVGVQLHRVFLRRGQGLVLEDAGKGGRACNEHGYRAVACGVALPAERKSAKRIVRVGLIEPP